MARSANIQHQIPNAFRFKKIVAHLKVLVRVTRKCNRQKSISFVQNGQNILSDASSSKTCSESSLEEELQKFDPDPDDTKNNRSVNGILQDRITRMWIVQNK
ncbi:hypothetical protein CEXT_443081 [Caerostris extrusa]|uniref:Uncharacterized protein n=1 Tax=Caerostris extrusa TaxID=172846 RepID=A0AAV4NPS2_CAEEX|nr:hypothetical protein CEXT_443081 [Caerostris extrusa]